MASGYRADIDGLRALAVVPVVFYHAGIEGFSGGFVGVDVFFVISGYLITSLIVNDIERGDYSVRHFYERRIRRIFPALGVVIFATLAFGILLLDTESLRGLFSSAIATVFFGSNILFWTESGYFDGPSELKPLLHTWSLAVEEQYYIVFPVIMLLIQRFTTSRYKAVLGSLCLLSFLACIWAVVHAPSAAFYLPQYRAWELLIGALLALGLFPGVTSAVAANALATAGLLLIGYSVVSYSESTAFPGIAALAPCIGAAMVIYAGLEKSSTVSRVLGSRPLVFIGLISYSLYLWHWPVIVFARQFSVSTLSPAMIAAVLVASFFLSVITWKYVETPFRRNRGGFSARQVFVSGFGMVVATTAVSVSVLAIGLDGRAGSLSASSDVKPVEMAGQSIQPAAPVVDADYNHEEPRWKKCRASAHRFKPPVDLCVLGDERQVASFFVWGDSHAEVLLSGLDDLAMLNGAAGEVSWSAACPPLIGIDRQHRSSCAELNELVIAYLAARPYLDTVVLSARWTLAATGTRYKQESGGSFKLEDLDGDAVGNTAVVESSLKRTLEKLKEIDKKVLLVGPIPEVGFHVPVKLRVALRMGEDIREAIAPTRAEYRQRNATVLRLFETLETTDSLQIVYPSHKLCATGLCAVVEGATPLYRDHHHLSTAGSKYLSALFEGML